MATQSAARPGGKRPLWVMITLYDYVGPRLATWTWDEMYPGVPPRFSYPNDNASCPYMIEFQTHQTWKDMLSTGDINRAIDDAIVIGIARARKAQS
jgi:hypothetical protein